MRRTIIAAALALAAASPATATAASRPGHADDVIQWNRLLLDLQATPGAQPPTVHPTYELAVVHDAMARAVDAAEHRARPVAAADAAARDTLLRLYPASAAAVQSEYGQLSGRLPAGRRTRAGVAIGRRVARQELDDRAGDDSGAVPAPFVAGTAPGAYRPTPPAFAMPVFTHWAAVRPFELRRASQFRPSPPPPLTGARYAAAIAEVQSLGVAQDSARTPDQTQIGLFWNVPIWATWNRIAQDAVLKHRGGVATAARTFATLDKALADSVIALYDAKYAFHFWRPVTAIQLAGDDGNPQTSADPAWTPLSATAPDPSYPGAHATVSAAAADVLAARYGDRFAFQVSSTALPGVERSFRRFSAAAAEAAVSRIYNGNHTRLDEDAGERLGHDVSGFALRRAGRGA